MDDQLFAYVFQDGFEFLFVFFREVEAQLQVEIDRFEGCAELAQVLQRLFPPAESPPDIENQGKNNGDAQQGKIDVITQVIMD